MDVTNSPYNWEDDQVNYYSLKYNRKTGEYEETGRESLDRFLAANEIKWEPRDTLSPAPRLTLWQRFWRSPWSHLVMALYFSAIGFGQHHVWYLTVLFVTCAVSSWLNFYNCADKRWGKP